MMRMISTKSFAFLQLSPVIVPTNSKQSPEYSSLPKSFILYTECRRS